MGLLAPKGTPPAIIDRLYRELKASLAAPDVKGFFTDAGLDVELEFFADYTPGSATRPAVQAVAAPPAAQPAPVTAALIKRLREVVPGNGPDRFLAPELEAAAEMLKN